MKDFLKDIIESSRDRIKTPITGSYTIAFLIYNWRPILFLFFSEASIEDKIVIINAEYCFWEAIAWPLAIALLYVVGVPYLMMFLENYTKKAVEGRKTHKSKQKLFDLNILKEISQQEFEIERIKTGQKEISDLNDKIISLTTQIERTNSQHKSQSDNYENIIDGYKKNEDNYKQNIKDLNAKLKSAESVSDKILDLSGIKDVVNKLTDNGKEYYLEFCRKRFFNLSGDVAVEYRYIDEFIDLNLITNDEGKYDITQFGIGVFQYLENFYLPF